MSVEDYRQATRIDGRSLEEHVQLTVRCRPIEYAIEGQLIRGGESVKISVPKSRIDWLKTQLIDGDKLAQAKRFAETKKREPGKPTPTVDSCYYELFGETIPPFFAIGIDGPVPAPLSPEDRDLQRLKLALAPAASTRADSQDRGKK